MCIEGKNCLHGVTNVNLKSQLVKFGLPKFLLLLI